MASGKVAYASRKVAAGEGKIANRSGNVAAKPEKRLPRKILRNSCGWLGKVGRKVADVNRPATNERRLR